jgi:peptidyl-prolyl cis-trans isomerase SurA
MNKIYIINKCTLVIFSLLGLTISGISQEKYVLDKVVTTVGDEFILLSDVETEFAYARTKQPTLPLEYKCNILDGLIAQNLIIHHAKLDSIEVADEELESMLDARFNSVLAQMNNDENFFEEYYGATISEMKDRYRDDQRKLILAERMQQQLISSVSITPTEVQEYYNAIPKDSLPYLDSEVELGELVMFPEVNTEERQKALDKITMILNKIQSGESTFEEMAKEHSMDGSAAQGGDLGFAKRGNYVPDFEAVAFTLDDAELSDVVETEFGFHIIKQVGRRGEYVKVKHIIIKPEITDADLELVKIKMDSIRTLINTDSMSFIGAVRRFGNKKVPSFSNAGRVMNPATGNTFFEADQLEADDYFAIESLDEEKVSAPLLVQNPRLGRYYKLLQLQKITRPHQASLELDYDKIAYFAKENKKGEYFSKWVETKMQETYIRVNATYEYCPDLVKWIPKATNETIRP